MQGDAAQGRSPDVSAIDAVLDDIIQHRRIRSVYQPIVDLGAGSVVAYEALARGPEGPLVSPEAMFAQARLSRRVADLDILCRAAALSHASAAGISRPLTLFINVEPEALDERDPDALEEMARAHASAVGDVSVVLEITERALAARPADLLRTVQRAREWGWRIALDDVGGDRVSLSFLPLLRPDVVKLDLSMVQDRPGRATGETMHVVNSYCEKTGALLLAEGIESADHVFMAQALGASLGQGYYFGRPSSSVVTNMAIAPLVLPAPEHPKIASSPFASLPSGTVLRRASKRLLIQLSKHLEEQARHTGRAGVLAAAFQHARHFTPSTADRYADAAVGAGFVAAFAEEMTDEPATGVRGCPVLPTDPICREWDIVLAGPQMHVALLARDLGDDGADSDRTFEYALTYDRHTVAAALRSMMVRVPPLPSSDRALDPDGAPRRTVRDAAVDRRRANDVLADRALDASVAGLIVVDVLDPQQPIVFVNAAFESLAGKPASALLGQNCRILQGERTDRTAVARMRLAIAQGRESHETIVNYRDHPDGPLPWWNELHLSPVVEDSGRIAQYIGVQNDVTARVESQLALERERERTQTYLSQIERLAYTDPLTGLANRRAVEERVDRLLSTARAADDAVILLYLDLDQFKPVNDWLGHAAGDELLRVVGRRLVQATSTGDMVGRLGGDEFLVVTWSPRGAAHADAVRLADQIHLTLGEPVHLRGESVTPSASIGRSSSPVDGANFVDLLHVADLRMYDEKRPSGR